MPRQPCHPSKAACAAWEACLAPCLFQAPVSSPLQVRSTNISHLACWDLLKDRLCLCRSVALKHTDSSGKVAQQIQACPPCIQGFGMIGVETDHCCEVLNCVVLLSQLLECGAPLKEGFGIFGLQCNYLRVVPNSTFI